MRIPGWLWLVLPTALTIVAVAQVHADQPDPLTVPPGAQGVEQAWLALGMGPEWAQFGRWVAFGESRYQITAQLGKPSDPRKLARGERAAAWRAYQRLESQGRFPDCPPVLEAAAPGGGGWYGQLWPFTTYFLAKRHGPLFADVYCDPVAVWRSAKLSTVAFLGQLRGTLAIAKNKLGGQNPTRFQLRALYGNPSRDPAEVYTDKRKAQYEASVQKAGLPVAWLYERVSELPTPQLGLEAIAEGDEDDAQILDDPEIAAALAEQATAVLEEDAAA